MSISDVKMTIDSGVELSAKDKSLASFGLQGDTATIFLTFRWAQYRDQSVWTMLTHLQTQTTSRVIVLGAIANHAVW